MLFIGAVGYIMGGTMLKELWSRIYAVDSIERMLNVHAYAHFLTHLALTVFILRKLEIDYTERE